MLDGLAKYLDLKPNPGCPRLPACPRRPDRPDRRLAANGSGG